MRTRWYALALGLMLLWAVPTAAAVTLSERDWQELKKTARGVGNVFPASPAVHDRFLLTSDSVVGGCNAGGGSAVTLCRWDGVSWTALSSATVEVDTLATVTGRGRTMTDATSVGTALRVGDAIAPSCSYTDSTLGPVVKPCTDANTRTYIWTDKDWCIFDIEGNSCMVTVDPDAASPNAVYQFTAPYKPIASFLMPLEPRGAATAASESLNTNFEKQWFLTVTDANTDAADFSFPVTAKMAGATTATFRLIGVSKNAAPSGNIDLDCAMYTYTPGTDTFAAHSTTGEVTATLTPATQYRPVAVTTSAHTINGGPLVDGDIVFGSCEVDATATTSAQMTDFRLWGNVLIQLSVNSWSD